MLHLEHSFIWCWNLDASGSRSETPGKFWDVVLEKVEKISWTDHVRNEEVLLRVKEQRNILHEIRKWKANWIGHILRRNWLLQRVIEGKIKGGIKVTGRWGRKRRKLLDDLKERRGYSQLKEEALVRTMWRARFGRGFGPVVRQTTKWMIFLKTLLPSNQWHTFEVCLWDRKYSIIYLNIIIWTLNGWLFHRGKAYFPFSRTLCIC